MQPDDTSSIETNIADGFQSSARLHTAMRGSPSARMWSAGSFATPPRRALADIDYALADAHAEMSMSAQRRATRSELADHIVGAMQGQLDGLEEIARLSPAEKIVVRPDTTAMALAPYIATMKQLKQIQAEVADLHVREREDAADELADRIRFDLTAYYEGKLARRDAKIATLQSWVATVQDELVGSRTRQERLEDALLERTAQLAESQGRANALEAALHKLEREPRSHAAVRSLDQLLETAAAVSKLDSSMARASASYSGAAPPRGPPQNLYTPQQPMHSPPPTHSPPSGWLPTPRIT